MVQGTVGPGGPARRSVPSEVAALADALLDDLDLLTDRLVEAILQADPSYTGPAQVERDDLWRSCHDNLRRVLQGLGAGRAGLDGLFDAPRATGQRRAEQGMPLEAVLHSYRLGFHIIWEHLVAEARRRRSPGMDVLVDAATEVWSVVDEFSSVVVAAYRATESERARRDDHRRTALLDALLEGRGRDHAVVTQAATALDLPAHGRYVALVVQGNEGARAARTAVASTGAAAAWRTRADRDVALVLVGTGGPEPLADALPATGLRAGLSPAVDGLGSADVAARLAETALRTLPPGERGVAQLDARLSAALLVTAPDLAGRLVRRTLGALADLDDDERDLLLVTLRTWLATGGSARETGAALFCHRNTVSNRLHRVEALTGRSLDRVDHLVDWSLALQALEVLGPGLLDR